MDWVKTFYARQNEWFAVYLGSIDESHHERAALLESLTHKAPKKILELGAGGGQTSIAMAQLGNTVTMIELLEDSVRHALKLIDQENQPKVEVIHGDFYQVALDQTFDVVCYFDSFGIGTDQDQRRLLKRIASWLAPNGSAIIEVGSTWYWGGIAKGKRMNLGDCIREYDFDPVGCRLIDRWWLEHEPDGVVNQSLRCYTPADLEMLLEGTGLKLDHIQAGGKVDYDLMDFIPEASLDECMTYYVRLVKTSNV